MPRFSANDASCSSGGEVPNARTRHDLDPPGFPSPSTMILSMTQDDRF
jgi:hypothetical protein